MSANKFIEHEVSQQVTHSKYKQEADDNVRKPMSRARKFLADRGVDCASPIHREEAAQFMVGFAILEEKLSEQMRAARESNV